MSNTTQIQKEKEAIISLELEGIQVDFDKEAKKKLDFDSLLLDAVDSAFSNLGNSNRQKLYFHLKNSFGIAREAIPQKVEAFANALEQIFGQSASLIEVQIMKLLRNKMPQFRFSPKQGNLSFIGYLTHVRSSCSQF